MKVSGFAMDGARLLELLFGEGGRRNAKGDCPSLLFFTLTSLLFWLLA
jgi:hypothetical protein